MSTIIKFLKINEENMVRIKVLKHSVVISGKSFDECQSRI